MIYIKSFRYVQTYFVHRFVNYKGVITSVITVRSQIITYWNSHLLKIKIENPEKFGFY